MAKQQLLTAIKETNRESFLDLIKQHGEKRNPLDLGEVLIELNQKQLDGLWTVLHSWANEEITKLVEPEAVETQQNCAGDALPPPPPPPLPQEGQSTAKDPSDDGQEQMEIDGDHPNTSQNEIQNQSKIQAVEQNELRNEGAQTQQIEPYNELVLKGVVDFTVVYVDTLEGPEAYIPDKLFELAVLLHGMVSILEGKVQESVLSLCESWWLHNLEEREHLIRNALLILIQSSLAKSARKKDIIRVCKLRNVLDVVDFDEPLVTLLVATVASPRYVSCDEGIRWISELFLQQGMVRQLHRIIKTVLPECSRDHSAKYGEIYFRAWKKSTGHVQQMLEEDCLQDLMYAAVHVDPIAGRLSSNLHHLLHQIHRHKRHHVVEKMILTLYNPFLWRSLKVANGYVRMNATGLLCDIFPLSDSTCSHEEREELLERQYQTIINLLTDPCHLVRITAIKGTCNILSDYWLMIPSQVIKIIFQKLLSELLCDSSSAEVRTQVLKGFTMLLDNNDAIPFLKEVLPRISDSFDDISASVRMAFVHLLLKVKALKVIRYWTIVPVIHLLHRLEDDVPSVCKLLTQLLLSSFHPIQKDDQELLQRCLALLEENRGAARRFYQYASRTLDLPSTVHFMLLIWHCLKNFIVSQQSQDSIAKPFECGDSSSEEQQPASSTQGTNKGSPPDRTVLRGARSKQNENKENRMPGQRTTLPTSHQETNKYLTDSSNKDEDEDEEDSPLDNPMVVGGLLDTIVILWSTNAHRLAQPQNAKYLEALRIRISKSMPLFFKFFKENKDVSQTLLYLSSFLPKSLVPTLVGHCLSRLRSLQQEENHGDSYITYINALCNWNRVDDVLELASDWLVEGFNTANLSPTKERRLSCRGVRFHETYTAQPSLALLLIRHILQHPLNKLAALTKNRRLVIDLAETLKTSKDLLSERINCGEELSNLCTDKFLCDVWSQYLSLVTVLHNPAQETQKGPVEDEEDEDRVTFDSCEHLQDCIDWANSVLLPALNSEEVGEKRKKQSSEDATKISVRSLLDLLKTCNNAIIIGAADSQFVLSVCSFSDVLLKSDKSEKFWEVILLVAQESHQYLQVYSTRGIPEGEGIVMPVDLVNSCITSITESLQAEGATLKDSENLEKTLIMVMTSMCQTRATQNEILQHLTNTIVDCLCLSVEEKKGTDSETKSIKEMGSCISLLVGVCQSRVKLSTGLMDALADYVTNSLMESTALLGISYLLKVLSKDSGKVSRYSLKQCVGAVDILLARIIFPAVLEESKDGEEGPHNVYEEYGRMTREIVDELKNSLGII